MAIEWLVQSNLLPTGQILPLVEVLRSEEIPYQDVTVIPFSEDINAPDNIANMIPYGSTRLIKHVQKYNPKGLFFDEELFRTSTWKQHRSDMLNSDALIMPLKEAGAYLKENPEKEYFIKPDNDLKDFAGALVMSSQFSEWVDRISAGGYLFNEDISVVVARPKDIIAEWRYFIVNGKIVTGSLYKVYEYIKKRRVDVEQTLKEAQIYANQWLPSKCVVMDLALTTDGLRVIEFNNINSSGFYDHDVGAFATELTKYVESL